MHMSRPSHFPSLVRGLVFAMATYSSSIDLTSSTRAVRSSLRTLDAFANLTTHECYLPCIGVSFKRAFALLASSWCISSLAYADRIPREHICVSTNLIPTALYQSPQGRES
jgi:hypothetical protein